MPGVAEALRDLLGADGTRVKVLSAGGVTLVKSTVSAVSQVLRPPRAQDGPQSSEHRAPRGGYRSATGTPHAAEDGATRRRIAVDRLGTCVHNEHRDAVEAAAVTRAFQVALVRACLPHTRFHDLRHAAATFLLAQGFGLEDVKNLLGHSSITLTSNTYGHVLERRQQQVAAGMDAALGG